MRNTADEQDRELWEGTRMAWLLGVSGRRLRQLVEEGVVTPVIVAQGKRRIRRYDPVETTRTYYEFCLRDRRPQASEDSEEARQRYEAARADLFEARAVAAQYRNDVETGKLQYTETITQDLKTFFVVFRAFALDMPRRIMSRFEGRVPTNELRRAEREMHEEVVQQLRDFAGGAADEDDDAQS